jgi:hypothetical protein
MAEPFDVTRIDPLPGRSPRDGVETLRAPSDRQRQKRRQHPHRDDSFEDDDQERQVGTKLDIRV